MRTRSLLLFLAILPLFLFLGLPICSAEPEKDFRNSLSELLPELRRSYSEALESDSLLVDNDVRRQQLSEIIRSADDVAIKIYTQNPGFAIDMALALQEVSRVHKSFNEQVRLSDRYLTVSRSGLRRYSLLGGTLRDMYMYHPVDSLMVSDSLLQFLPPVDSIRVENPEEKALLDSCLHYADALTLLYGKSVVQALQDSIDIAETERRLQQAYDYAQSNYTETQKNIFIGGNVTILEIIKNWDALIENVGNDLELRFKTEPVMDSPDDEWMSPRPSGGKAILTYASVCLLALFLAFILAGLAVSLICRWSRREWLSSFRPIISSILAILLFSIAIIVLNIRGENPYWQLAYRLLIQFSWLTLAIFISLLIRIRAPQARPSRSLYIPTLLLAFMNILLRAMFVPASLVPLIFPPGLLVFIIWQTCVNVRYRKEVNRTDLRYMWVSVLVMAVSGILSLAGYSMVGVFILTFWTFLLALLHTITTVYFLMKRYYENKVTKRKARYHEENPFLPLEDQYAFIEVTWFYDLIRMVVLPVTILLSFPLSARLTSHAYQLSLTGTDLMRQSIFQNEKFAGVTLLNIVIIIALFFVFSYLIYLTKGLARVIKLRRIIEKRKSSVIPLKESDVNMSLLNSIITLLGWLIYLFIVFSILRVSTSALALVSTGLAAGIGFALKDLINNFFYGVQLMAGRIRVGDKISCEGVRGIVKRVSYQTTLIEEEDGSLIAFTNTNLFTKQFRNLNSGKNYELLKIPVGVRYGTDIGYARNVILEALKPLMTLDKSGRDIVDPSFPIDVRFDGFGNSSINIIVALYTTVETHYTFPSRAKEAIYYAFHEHGIDIPFNQHDVYIKQAPETDKP